MSNRTGGELWLAANFFTNDFFLTISTRHQRVICKIIAVTTILADCVLVEPDGIEPTTSCLQSRRSPS